MMFACLSAPDTHVYLTSFSQKQKAKQRMTHHWFICVPYVEAPHARTLGALWCRNARRWYCNTAQLRSKTFRRWRDHSTWLRFVVYPGDGASNHEAAKRNRCAWDADAKEWVVVVTHDSSLTAWHRMHRAPPSEVELNVPFDDRARAKALGARWNPTKKAWVYASHAPLPTGLVALTCVQRASKASVGSGVAAGTSAADLAKVVQLPGCDVGCGSVA
jgi:RES domain-containing protein